jgi:hypothetical protein
MVDDDNIASLFYSCGVRSDSRGLGLVRRRRDGQSIAFYSLALELQLPVVE